MTGPRPVAPEVVAGVGQLAAAYTHAMDTSDAEALLACLAADGEVHVAGGAVLDRTTLGSVAARARTTAHLTMNVHVAAAGPGWASCQAHFLLFDLATGDRLAAGRYLDDCVEEDGTWRWRVRRVLFGWVADGVDAYRVAGPQDIAAAVDAWRAARP